MNPVQRFFAELNNAKQQKLRREQAIDEKNFYNLIRAGVSPEDVAANSGKYDLGRYGKQLAQDYVITPQERAEANALYYMSRPNEADMLTPNRPDVNAIIQNMINRVKMVDQEIPTYGEYSGA